MRRRGGATTKNRKEREPWKCRGCGKRGQPKAGFPLFPRAPWNTSPFNTIMASLPGRDIQHAHDPRRVESAEAISAIVTIFSVKSGRLPNQGVNSNNQEPSQPAKSTLFCQNLDVGLSVGATVGSVVDEDPSGIAGWIPKTVDLKYFISDFCLMTARFAALVPDHGFDPATSADADPGLPLPQLPAGIEALFMPSRPVAKPLPRYGWFPNCIRYAPRQYPNVYVSFDGSFDDYLSGFSCKSRATLRRKVRRLAQLSGGTIEWREFRGAAEMAEFQQAARGVAAKTFQERLFHGALPGTAQFLEEMRLLADRDNVRGYLLYLKHRAIAYLYFPAKNGVLLYSFLGHDPEYNEFSPGTVLLYLALESLFQERRFRLLNFGQGGMQQKQQFSTGEVYCADIYFLRRKLRNLLLVSSHILTDAISRGAGGVLAKLRVKRTFKRLLRYGSS